MSIDFNADAATRLTINPEPKSPDLATPMRKPIQKATLGDNTNGSFWGADGFSFDDLLDLVNPLQHIPVVSTIYRAITGDTIAPGPRLIGGSILGGVVGFAASAATIAFEQESGTTLASSVASRIQPPEPAQANNVPATEPVPEKNQEAKLIPEDPLEPIDFEEVMPETATSMATAAPAIPPSMPAPASAKHANRYDNILSLFDQQQTDAYQKYNKIQSLDPVLKVARDMKM